MLCTGLALTLAADCAGQAGKKSAIDLLSTTNLVNYFGKADNVNEIEISPILIVKGDMCSCHIRLQSLSSFAACVMLQGLCG